MKISEISIRNFRSIEALDLVLDDYTALVGVNGSGKSSVLYAIDWMLNGRALLDADVHRIDENSPPFDAAAAPKTVSVELTFTDLTPQDRTRLEKYGRGESLTVRKSWVVGEPKPKMIGKSLQGPGFLEVRSASAIGTARSAYAQLRAIHTDLPEATPLAKAPELDALLSEWEDQGANRDKLVPVDDDDAYNFFGFDGQARLKQCLRMVLVPAASDISSEIAGSKKGSAVADLLSVLMASAGAEARDAWITKHSPAIEELTDSMRSKVAEATGLEADRINKRLQALVPNSSVTFTPEIPTWVPSPTPVVTTDVSIDGITHDVARQGHGVQRAVMIAMFQSLAPDEDLTERTHVTNEGESDEDAAARLALLKLGLPALIVCIEEPEIYQHPVRARAFARVLEELSTQPRVQVLLATHSPYFVRPSQFESVRRFTLAGGKSSVDSTTVADVATATVGSGKVDQVRKTVAQQLGSTFSEAFFATRVVLVEGDSDKAVVEEVAKKLGLPLDAAGISVVDVGGKENLRVPNGIVSELGLQTYIVADADALGSSRKAPAKQAGARVSHQAATDLLVGWLPAAPKVLAGSLPFAFGDPTLVSSTHTLWMDDLETELQQWPSFVAAQSANKHATRSKDMLAYMTDVADANLNDMPDTFRHLIEAIHAQVEGT